MDQVDLIEWVEQAREGDKAALEALLDHIQRPVYNLTLRMLQSPADAEDAAQEILIKVITHLATFKGDAAFTTWVYRIASNYLLTVRRRHAEQHTVNFETMSERLQASLALGEASVPEQVEFNSLVAEVRLNCMLGMLMCLDRTQRIALILGEVLVVSSDEAAYILEIPAATYRKQLSRARTNLRTFIQGQCGLVNPANPCRCAKHVGNKIKYGLMDVNALDYVPELESTTILALAETNCADLHQIEDEVRLIRTLPEFAQPAQLLDGIRAVLAKYHV